MERTLIVESLEGRRQEGKMRQCHRHLTQLHYHTGPGVIRRYKSNKNLFTDTYLEPLH